jgi:hypothetical protein
MNLKDAVDLAVGLIHAIPTCDDSTILDGLAGSGVDRHTAIRIVQFVQIAFTRFLFRDRGVRFADQYAIMAPGGQVLDYKPIAAEPAFRQAWAHCERVAADGLQEDYFTPIAARSGGYRSLMEMVHKGLNLNGVITSPPILTA